MSDEPVNGGFDLDAAPIDPNGTGDASIKHETARHMAEAAMRAEAAGDTEQASRLLEQAEQADPEAVIDVVEERAGEAVPSSVDSSDELSTMSETVQPGSDAPSRAGISGSSSGADTQDL